MMCNAMMLIHTEEMVKRKILPKELLDLPDYGIPAVHFNKDEPSETEDDSLLADTPMAA
jgi:hypothetical protein